MRRAWSPVMPALSYHFHLTWLDLRDMPAREREFYLDALHELNRKR